MRTPIILQKTSDSLRSGVLTKYRDLAKKPRPAARSIGRTNERIWRIAKSKDSCQWRMITSLAPLPSVRATMDPRKKSQLTERLGIKKNKKRPPTRTEIETTPAKTNFSFKAMRLQAPIKIKLINAIPTALDPFAKKASSRPPPIVRIPINALAIERCASVLEKKARIPPHERSIPIPAMVL